jgi:HD-GYP domain-containing protein (c-di-GMP phosphodiesterase class II)
MTSPRAFREARTPQEAMAILSAEAGAQFDPAVFDAFRKVVQHRKSLVFLNVDDSGS